jgi:hypothetical protein
MRLDFSKLESLRLLCRQIQQYQVASLNYFACSPGFGHVPGRQRISISSSATCVLSLVATGKWLASKSETKELLRELLRQDRSADLPHDNPFTNAWILEGVTALEGGYSDALGTREKARIDHKVQKLQSDLEKGNGGISILGYPPSPYLTQLVVRVLQSRNKFTSKLERTVRDWAWGELARQLALVQAKSKTRDAYAVAYLLMLVTAVTPVSNISPEQASIQRAALDALFDSQLPDGTWPLSRPLFPYPGFGDAYCYEYEMLTQLLKRVELHELLLEHLPKLGSSAESVLRSIYRVKGDVPAWTSGHHPNQTEPESWATASVYHFIYELDRLLAQEVRYEIFRHLEIPFPRAGKPRSEESEFANKFLDSEIEVDGVRRSLKGLLWIEFVRPLSEAAPGVARGIPFRKGTPRSAILFGPPGTSKTEYAREISEFLGWPHLALDPSHFLRSGMDGIQAEANKIFRILQETERVVVLFDEFDELVRERGSSSAEPFSRLLTTAMLPKLARLYKAGTLVFIIATNNIGEFDLAIRREGRFDRVMQVMPPTYKAKMTKLDWGPGQIDVGKKLRTLGVRVTREIKSQLEDLTYGEFETFAGDLAAISDKQEAIRALGDRWKKCTLQTRVSKPHVSKEGETTWAERCKTEAIHNR